MPKRYRIVFETAPTDFGPPTTIWAYTDQREVAIVQRTFTVEELPDPPRLATAEELAEAISGTRCTFLPAFGTGTCGKPAVAIALPLFSRRCKDHATPDDLWLRLPE